MHGTTVEKRKRKSEKYSSEQVILHYYCRSCFSNRNFILFNCLSVTVSAKHDIVRRKVKQNSLCPPWKRMQE